MKKRRVKCGYRTNKYEIKSMFLYGNEEIKKIIWSLKTNSMFYNSENGNKLMESVRKEIQNKDYEMQKTIVICAPSSSFWQNKKGFDHMHIFMKACLKNWRKNSSTILTKSTQHIHYIPYAIVPKLNKSLQKALNKKDRQKQTLGAYGLSNYFKFFLRTNKELCNILILDDVKTTGSTLNECSEVVEDYLNYLLDKQKINLSQKEQITIRCLTIAYEA